jgi:site-specific DNA-methyltransferase (adenine-specific)
VSAPEPYWSDGQVSFYLGDCVEVLETVGDASVDAVVTDPPYGLEFMGKEWDGADGFRRSLNPADADRDSVFGRTSRTAPEYRTAGAGQRGVPGIGDRATEWVSNQGWNGFRCRTCGHLSHGGSPCECETPDFARADNRWHVFQAWCEQWAAECLRVLKPGGYLVAFGGTRTYHRMACAIEDAGFEIRDSLHWIYGSGFPKSLDVSKAIDKAARGVPQGGADLTSINHGKYRTQATEGKRSAGDSGQGYGAGPAQFMAEMGAKDDRELVPEAEQWSGWGTALKPAHEPIVLARKPLAGTVAQNVLTHGTGALNVDGCRVGSEATTRTRTPGDFGLINDDHWEPTPGINGSAAGRWPPNVLLGPEAAEELDRQSGVLTSGANPARRGSDKFRDAYGDFPGQEECMPQRGADSGGASRFFPVFRYEPKAGSDERPRLLDGTAHPTVKPVDLMRWLVRLVTPRDGLVLDPFAGTGTTAEACIVEGFRCLLVEKDPAYAELIRTRLRKPIQPDMFGGAA